MGGDRRARCGGGQAGGWIGGRMRIRLRLADLALGPVEESAGGARLGASRDAGGDSARTSRAHAEAVGALGGELGRGIGVTRTCGDDGGNWVGRPAWWWPSAGAGDGIGGGRPRDVATAVGHIWLNDDRDGNVATEAAAASHAHGCRWRRRR